MGGTIGKMMLPFFVYGTLKPGGSNYKRFLAGRTATETPAYLERAALYDYGPYPFLVVAPDIARAEERVCGMLMRLRPEVYGAALAQLDDLEQYDPTHADSMYLRIACSVQTDAGAVACWVYVAGRKAEAAIRAGQMPKIEGGEWRVTRDT